MGRKLSLVLTSGKEKALDKKDGCVWLNPRREWSESGDLKESRFGKCEIENLLPNATLSCSKSLQPSLTKLL